MEKYIKSKENIVEYLLLNHEGLIRHWNFGHNPNLTAELIERFIHKPWTGSIWRNPNLTERLIEIHMWRVDWVELSQNPNLSERMIIRYDSKIDYDHIVMNDNLSIRIIHKYFNKWTTKNQWFYISGNKNITIEFVDRWRRLINWEQLSEKFMFTLEQLKKYESYINFQSLSNNKHLTIDILKYYENRMNWNSVAWKIRLTEEVWKLYSYKFSHYFLCGNDTLFQYIRHHNIKDVDIPNSFQLKYLMEGLIVAQPFSINDITPEISQLEEIIIKQERTHVLRYLEPWLLSKVSRKIDLHLKKLQIQGAAEYFSVCHTMAYNTHLTVEIIKKYNLINETCIIPLLENNYLYDMKTCRSLYRKELTEKYTLQTFGKDIGGYILQFLYY